MGEAQDRYWQAVESTRDNVGKGGSGAALQRSDRFESMGREVEKEASLLRLCQDAHDEALKELIDTRGPGTAKSMNEFEQFWPKRVLEHDKLLRYFIDTMRQMLIWEPQFREASGDLQSDD